MWNHDYILKIGCEALDKICFKCETKAYWAEFKRKYLCLTVGELKCVQVLVTYYIKVSYLYCQLDYNKIIALSCKLKKKNLASMIAQLVKNSTAMQNTPVRFLSWKDPLEKGKATHSSILAWRIPWSF